MARGRRERAGRKKTGKSYVPHGRRPFHASSAPVHVTYRVVAGFPNLRASRVAAMLSTAIGKAHKETFRICHFSIQSNHIHLLVEAGSKTSLSRGMQGLAIRMAKYTNRALGRRGRVFSERYHARELASPTETRHALAYVLLNRAHHVSVATRPGPLTIPTHHPRR